MSTRRSISALTGIVALVLLSGCAAPVPVAAPQPVESAPVAGPSPPPIQEFACTDLDAAVGAEFRAAPSFHSAGDIATAVAGGVACSWAPSAPGGAVAAIYVTLLPADAVQNIELIDSACGDEVEFDFGCVSRAEIDGVIVETTLAGDERAEETARVLERVSTATRDRLERGIAPLKTNTAQGEQMGCPIIDQSAVEVPPSVGSLPTDFGGTDAGAPFSRLRSYAIRASDGLIGCAAATTGGFGVHLDTLGRGAELLDDPQLAGAFAPLSLADGRRALIQVSSANVWNPNDDRHRAYVVVEVDEGLVLLQVTDLGSNPEAAPIEVAATALTEVIVAALERRP